MVRADRCGLFRIDRDGLRRMPEEIALRLIGRCIAAAGGSGEPVSLAKLEPIVAGIWGDARGRPRQPGRCRARRSPCGRSQFGSSVSLAGRPCRR